MRQGEPRGPLDVLEASVARRELCSGVCEEAIYPGPLLRTPVLECTEGEDGVSSVTAYEVDK